MTASDPVVETAGSRFASLLRDVAVGGLAGLLSGFIVSGVGGRVVMRLTSLVAPDAVGLRTESGFVVGTVTLDGTLELLVFAGVGFGLLGGLLLVILWPWVSKWARWRSVAVGGFVLAFGSTEAVDPTNRDFPIVGNELFAVLLFWSLFFAWGFVAVWLHGVFDRRFPSGSRRSTVTYGVIAALGLPSVWLLVETLLSEFTDIPSVVGISVLVLGLATLGMWTLRVLAADRSLSRAVRIVGYSAFIVILVVGLLTAFSDALEIIT